MGERATRENTPGRSVPAGEQQLEEMKRLGFWEQPLPAFPEELNQREDDLSRELNELLAKTGKDNKEKGEMLLRQRARQKKLEKAARRKLARPETIPYLGEEVSPGLRETETNTPLLQKYNLPVCTSFRELGEQMNCDLPTLQYLLYNRKVTSSTHYYTFKIPKKSGGMRTISAPKQKLKRLQYWVTENILNRLPVCDQVHGFAKERSILTNASPHLEKDIVVNLDLKDFFPSISYKRVKGLFRKFGYSEQLSILLALICTEAQTRQVELNGQTWYIQKNRRSLPQGSPASPAISNLIAYTLDKRLEGIAKKYNFTYTRYADDLTFSAYKEQERNITKLLYFIRKVIREEGFTVHPEKTQIMRKNRQQRVTGIVVNQRPNIDRQQLRRFRALLHHIEVNGWQQQQWGHPSGYLPHSIEGYINFIRMVHPHKAKKFEEQLMKIVFKHGYPAGPASSPETRIDKSGEKKNRIPL